MRLPRSAAVFCFLTVLIGTSPAHTESICLHVQAGERSARYPVAAGSRFDMSFLHSIYATEVQEQFRITPSGFQTDRLRYAELRLAEFYGHEAAKLEQGWWTVNNPGTELRHLDVRVSEGSNFRISFGERKIRLAGKHGMGDSVRLLIIPCGDPSRGR